MRNKMSAKERRRRRKSLSRKHDRCYWCGQTSDYLTIDHVIPISNGGKHSLDNLVLSCKECNFNKGSLHPSDLLRNKIEDIQEAVSNLSLREIPVTVESVLGYLSGSGVGEGIVKQFFLEDELGLLETTSTKSLLEVAEIDANSLDRLKTLTQSD